MKERLLDLRIVESTPCNQAGKRRGFLLFNLTFTNRYNSMLPSVYVSPLKLHSATKINLHGVSDSALFRNYSKVRLSPHLYLGVLGVSIEDV